MTTDDPGLLRQSFDYGARLREAADELESWHEVDEYELVLARFLRAVADDPNGPHVPTIVAAALAMADTICGSE